MGFVDGVEVRWRGGEPPCTCTAAGKILDIVDLSETRVYYRDASGLFLVEIEKARVLISFNIFNLSFKKTEEVRTGEKKRDAGRNAREALGISSLTRVRREVYFGF